jgi:hypothetical protein
MYMYIVCPHIIAQSFLPWIKNYIIIIHPSKIQRYM